MGNDCGARLGERMIIMRVIETIFLFLLSSTQSAKTLRTPTACAKHASTVGKLMIVEKAESPFTLLVEA